MIVEQVFSRQRPKRITSKESFFRLRADRSVLTAHKSVAHFGACGVGTFRDEFEANRRPTMRAPPANGCFVEAIVLIVLQPHQLEALGAPTDLRCHDEFLTLGVAGWGKQLETL